MAPTWCSYLVDGLPTKRTWFSSSSWIFLRHSTLRHFRTDPTCKTTNFSDSTLYRVRSSSFSAFDTGRNLLRSTPLYTNGSTSQPSRRYVASASLDWVSTRSVFKNGTAGSRSDEAANQSPWENPRNGMSGENMTVLEFLLLRCRMRISKKLKGEAAVIECITSGLNALTFALSLISYTHLRAHETPEHLVCRLLLEK